MLLLFLLVQVFATPTPTPGIVGVAPILKVVKLTTDGFNIEMNNTLNVGASWVCTGGDTHLPTRTEIDACFYNYTCPHLAGDPVNPGALVSVDVPYDAGSNKYYAIDCYFFVLDGNDNVIAWSQIGRTNLTTLPKCEDGNNCSLTGSDCFDAPDGSASRCGPTYDGGLQVNAPGVCGNGVNSVTLTKVDGSDWLYWCLKLGLHSSPSDFDPEVISVWIVSSEDYSSRCSLANFTFVGTTHIRVKCRPPPDMGRDFMVETYFRIMDRWWVEVTPIPTYVFSYPDPIIYPHTLRTEYNDTLVSSVLAEDSASIGILFDVKNVLVPFWWPFGVFYGTEEDPVRYYCSFDMNSSTTSAVPLADDPDIRQASTLFCGTSWTDYDEEPYRFAITVLGAVSRGNDTFQVPNTQPRIMFVNSTGCVDDTVQGSTHNCPTKGYTAAVPALLTISGYNFQTWRGLGLGVIVGTSKCTVIDAYGEDGEINSVVCRLPQGTGSQKPVFVRVGASLSPFRILVSYISPFILGLCGCNSPCVVGANRSLSIAGCPREGGVIVEIFGTNFGQSNADVLVGGVVCATVEHDPSNPHEHLNCMLPPGAFLSRNILVSQSNGANSVRTSSASLSYRECPPGQYQNGSETTCANCSIGKFSAFAGQTVCEDCVPGSIQVSAGGSQCTSCAVGKYQSLSNATSCLTCPVGRFAATQGNSFCALCEPGKRAPNASESTLLCIDCPVGTFQSAAGASVCLQCEPGKANIQTGQTTCKDCPSNTIAEAGQVTCSSCPLDTVVIDKVCSCKPLTYLAKRDDKLECADCVPGMMCDGAGVTTQNALASPGFIKVQGTIAFQACIFPAYCPGATAICASHRTGPLCNLCDPGYKPVTGQGACEACPNTDVALGNVVGVFLGLFAALVVVYILVVRSDLSILKDKAPIKGRLWYTSFSAARPASMTRLNSESSVSGASTEDTSVSQPTDVQVDEPFGESFLTPHRTRPEKRTKKSVSYQFKIVITYLQLVTSLTAFNQVSWPPSFVVFMSAFDFVNLNFLPWNYVGCLSDYTLFMKIIFTSCIPIVLLAVFGLPLLAYLWCREHYDLADSDEGRKARVARRAMFLRVIMFTVFLCYPVVSRQIAGYFRCVAVQTGPGVEDYYLKDSFGERCYDDAWFNYLGYVIVLALAYPFLVPLGLFLILRKYRTQMKSPLIRFGLGLAFLGFYERYWWFEVADMSHKLVLGSIVGLIQGPDQWVVGCVVAALYGLTLLMLRPYIRDADNQLHLLAQLNVYLLILSLKIGQYDTISPGSLPDVFISILLIAIVITVFCYFLLRLTLHVKKSSHMIRRWLSNRKRQPSQLGLRKQASTLALS